MASNDQYAHLLEDEEFVKWFWLGDHGNKLIENLNRDKSREEIVRREKYSPVCIWNRPKCEQSEEIRGGRRCKS